MTVVPYHETRLPELNIRPDYAVGVNERIVGYVEIKQWGRGVDPHHYRGHDKRQWEQLKALPNVLYSDGRNWALYRAGERFGEIARVTGDVRRPGTRLRPADGKLADLIERFVSWQPDQPRTIEQLVRSTARLCRLMREEVLEAMALERLGRREPRFLQLAKEWRILLFPEATDPDFADGYAQTVTFALLLARRREISFEKLTARQIAHILSERRSLMGRALEVLTDGGLIDGFDTAFNALVWVVAAVDWQQLEGSGEDIHRKFYEEFLEEYDPGWRRKTGSYYTPDPVAAAMVRFVGAILSDNLGHDLGFADPKVVVVDPAMGTGTYLAAVVDDARRVVVANQGEGAVKGQLRGLAKRLIGLEKQIGPFSVAEWRIHAALGEGVGPDEDINLFVADTLTGPDEAQTPLFSLYEPILRSRQGASRVKREVRVLVAMGNPPYAELAMDRGNWIVRGDPASGVQPPLDDFRLRGKGSQEFKLHNLYVYFWRWATWKVFDAHPDDPSGVVAFISTAGYLSGPGLAGMRRYLRERADEGWIIDLSPEGHRPDVASRIFPHVQRPICIGVFVRSDHAQPSVPARIRYRALAGSTQEKMEALASISPDDEAWEDCPEGWEEPFRPTAGREWEQLPQLDDLMPWRRYGMIGARNWIFGVDEETLKLRWQRLLAAPVDEKRRLLKETRDRTIRSRLGSLPGIPPHQGTLADETDPEIVTVRVARRSFDRQYLLADNRVVEMARPELWHLRGPGQVFVSGQHVHPTTSGPAITFAGDIPDADCYNGRGGRVRPLWLNPQATEPNLAPGLMAFLRDRLGVDVGADDVLAYVAGIVAHPTYTRRFREELETPGVRVPITANQMLWTQAVDLGRQVIWLQSYGERFIDSAGGRPAKPTRMSQREHRAFVEQPIPDTGNEMPDKLQYTATTRTLRVGAGRIAQVAPEVWAYEVSGLRVLKSWFEYRKKKPSIKRSSELDDIQPDEWRADKTTELLKLLDVLSELVALEPTQGQLLSQICSGPLLSVADLEAAGVLPVPSRARQLILQRPDAPGQEQLPLEPSRSSDKAARSVTAGSRPVPSVPPRKQARLPNSSRRRRRATS